MVKIQLCYTNPLLRQLKNRLNNILASRSTEIVLQENHQPLTIRGYQVDYHDFHHFEVSQLERIKIGEAWVSGIHGLNSPIFHDNPIIEEYNGSWDEVRVAVHEWLTQTSIARTVKILIWTIWLMANNINPIQVIHRHYKSLTTKN